jgi:hypothetical protein
VIAAQGAAAQRGHELVEEIRQFNALLEYVEGDMRSPRYQTLTPEAKEIVDRSHEDFKAALECAKQEWIGIRSKMYVKTKK